MFNPSYIAKGGFFVRGLNCGCIYFGNAGGLGILVDTFILANGKGSSPDSFFNYGIYARDS